MIRILIATALIVVAPVSRAGCDDAPGPGVDWSGCNKER
ncbi:MAG: pentapeptide repeat-containing protein, partial [Betaproteobacteria bacterium]